MDLSVFLTPDNLIFLLIWLVILAIFLIVCFIILRAIYRFIKKLILKIFKKKEKVHAMEGALIDKGEDISLQVEELEKSRRETVVTEAKEEKEVTAHVKTPPLEYTRPIETEKKQEGKTDKQKEFKEGEKKDIEAGLEGLKHPGEQEERSFLERQAILSHGEEFMPKITIPIPRRRRRGSDKSHPDLEKESNLAPESRAGQVVQKSERASDRKDVSEAKTETPQAKSQDYKKAIEAEAEKEIEKFENKKIKDSPVVRATAQKQPIDTPEARAAKEQTQKISHVQQIKSNFDEETDQKKQIGVRTEKNAEKENPLYERLEFLEDRLGFKKIKERTEEKIFEERMQKNIEDNLKMVKHPDREKGEERFLKKESEKRAENVFGKSLKFPKTEVPISKKYLSDEDIDISGDENKQKQAESQKETIISPVKSAKIQSYSKKQEITSQIEEKEIPIYEKPDFMKDELGVQERREKKNKEDAGLSPIERAKLQKSSFAPSEENLAEFEQKGPLDYEKTAKGISSNQEKEISIYEKPEFMKDELGLGKRHADQRGGTGVQKDSTIFGGKEELTRVQLRHRLRYDPKVWKAGVKSRFNLTRQQRESLEKELFPKIYGRNISKSDFNRRVRSMIKERGGSITGGRVAKAENLRREINFLKKISGVKGGWKK